MTRTPLGKPICCTEMRKAGAVEIEQIGMGPEQIILGKAAQRGFGHMVVGDIEMVRRAGRGQVVGTDQKPAADAGAGGSLGAPLS